MGGLIFAYIARRTSPGPSRCLWITPILLERKLPLQLPGSQQKLHQPIQLIVAPSSSILVSSFVPDFPCIRLIPILIQGGPGGSGVSLIFVPNLADSFRLIVGDEYDLIGFDPRGASLVNSCPLTAVIYLSSI